MADERIEERAAELAREWLAAAGDGPLGGALAGPDGPAFAIAAVDGVLRPESLAAAAREMQRLAPRAPAALPWYVRGPVRAGGVVAPVLPAAAVPLARSALREMVSHVVLDARPARLGAAIERLRAVLAAPALDDDIAVPVEDVDADDDGERDAGDAAAPAAPRSSSAPGAEDGHDRGLEVDAERPIAARVAGRVVGAPVLGDEGSARRLTAVRALVDGGLVDEVTVALRDALPPRSPWAFAENVTDAVERLAPLALAAAERGVRLAIESDEPRTLDLAVAVATALYEDARLAVAPVALALPADIAVWRELRAWARSRDADLTLRLVAPAPTRADDEQHGWPAVPLDAVACLDEALRPASGARVSVGDHDPVHLAVAALLGAERGVDVEAVVPFGIHPALREAIARDVAGLVVDVPVSEPGDLEPAFVARRLRDLAPDAVVAAPRAEPITRPEVPGEPASLTQAVLGIARGDETAPVAPVLRFGGDEYVETAVFARREGRHLAVGAPGFRNAPDTDPAAAREWVQAIFGRLGAQAAQAVSVTDARASAGHAGAAPREVGIVPRDGARMPVAEVRGAATEWAARSAADRATVLERVADALHQRRAALIEAAAADTGALLDETDADVTAVIDATRYAAATARALDAVAGAVFVPDRLTLVAVDPAGAVRAAGEGLASALAAGAGVVLCSPAPRCAATLAEAFRAAGVPQGLLAVAASVDALAGDDAVGSAADGAGDAAPDDADPLGADESAGVAGADGPGHLAADEPGSPADAKRARLAGDEPRAPAEPRALDEPRALADLVAQADRVVLSGTRGDAARLRALRPDLPIVGDAGGATVVVVMPSADLDEAAADIAASAFVRGRAAVSLAILVGAAASSRRFARQLADAVRARHAGTPDDPRAEVAPLLEPVDAIELGEGESWLVEPRRLDDEGRLWAPGIRLAVRAPAPTPAPVLTVVHAPSLAVAIERQNAACDGLAAGLFTRDPVDLETWLEAAEAGSLFVNRAPAEGRAQRRPFGGWNASSVGPGAQAGGAHRVAALGSWRAADGGTASSTLHLRGLDTRIASLIESAQPTLDYPAFEWLRRGALSDAVAWRRDIGQVRDEAQLECERSLVRFRPVPVEIRAEVDAAWHRLLRVVVAGIRAGSPLTVSAPLGLPAAVRHLLGAQDVAVFVETDDQWTARMAAQRPPRVRLVGRAETVARTRTALARALGGDLAVAIHADEVTTAGRVELLPFVREQSIAIRAHRFGAPDPWSEEVV